MNRGVSAASYLASPARPLSTLLGWINISVEAGYPGLIAGKDALLNAAAAHGNFGLDND